MTHRLLTISAVMATALAAPALAQERFATADAAAQALIDAAEHHDNDRLSVILGPNSKGLLTSGDAATDRGEQTEFARLAHAKHGIEVSPMNRNRAILAIGEEDWPFPVPIVRSKDKWSFDTSETSLEMQSRRVGTDELDAIEICRGYVDAQRKYAAEDRDKDGLLKYAAHLMSSPGRHDGLYWEGADQQLVPQGFALAQWEPTHAAQAKAYHGYYFRILTGQGPHAPGGAHVYVVKGKLVGGFGLVAWPAKYGTTGVHTFIVNQNGEVYEKDLVPVPGKTAAAPAITSYDPDPTWKRVE